MKYLNVGCGNHYSKEKIWVNLDFNNTDVDVIAHNLLQGIPFPDHTFSVVYHSHVLEHFAKNDGHNFLKECHRVLKSGGILRIAIPDLEQIAKLYIKLLEEGLKKPEDETTKANYNWILLEMYDQTVRNYSGGEMGEYLFQNQIINEDFVYQRIGEEGRSLRKDYLNRNQNNSVKKKSLKHILMSTLNKIKNLIKNTSSISKIEQIGRFRLAGEIHQWMYDRYSIQNILKELGFENIVITDAFTSKIDNWASYNLDGITNIIRKPDSLFIEAAKK